MLNPRRILVVGNGGRECALANAMLLSPEVERLLITPPNWGVVDPHCDADGASRAGVLELKVDDHAGLVAAAKEHGIDLAVVGPEAPLVAGLTDELQAAGIAVLGCNKKAAQLEGSKIFAKEFMARCGIPTGGYEVFDDAGALEKRCEALSGPCVLKADGLAAGKGVLICDGRADALTAACRLLVEREFGAACDRVLLEERLDGAEISFTCLISGGEGVLLASSTDYKRIGDQDTGPNTGGMGNICPTPHATDEVVAEFHERIFTPLLAGLKADGLDYRGFLFIGTMLTADGLKVLEFNVRLGDPEAQVVLPLADADWPLVFGRAAQGQLDVSSVRQRPGACVAVCAATRNYPYGKSEPSEIRGLDRIHARGLLAPQIAADGSVEPPPVAIYFAGVARESVAAADEAAPGVYRNFYDDLDSARYMAAGGRVLAVSAQGEDLSEARRITYEVLGNLTFDGMKFRGDIGKLR